MSAYLKRVWKTKKSVISIIKYDTFLGRTGRLVGRRYLVMLREVRPAWRRGRGFLSPIAHKTYAAAAKHARKAQQRFLKS